MSGYTYQSISEQTPLVQSARAAYQSRDVAASVEAHQLKQTHGATEQHTSPATNYLPNLIILGGTQGILSAIATIFAVLATNIHPSIIMAIGFAHALASGLSMGASEVLGSMAEQSFVESEILREKWELEVNVGGEIAEMVDLYTDKGMTLDDARKVWNIYARYPKLFLEVMLAQECKIILPETPHVSPYINGIITALSFIFFSFIPISPFLLSRLTYTSTSATATNTIPYAIASTLTISISIILSILVLFILGIYKGKHSGQTIHSSAWIRDGIQLVLLGSVTAFVAFSMGSILVHFFPEIIR